METHERLMTEPAHFADCRYDAADDLPREQLEKAQLACIRRRFVRLRGRVRVLDRIAEDCGIDSLDSLQDVVPLLFPHTVFKSYPLQWIEEARFDRLTRWLGALSAADLSHVDVEGIDSLDDWIEHLDRHTELHVLHTFGTSGKLSFIPNTRSEWQLGGKLIASCIRDWYGRGSGPDLMQARLPFIHPSYRFGAGAVQRGAAAAVSSFAGGDHNCLFLYPGARFSADVAALAGRVRAAESQGEQESIVMPPALRARQEEFAARTHRRERDLQQFYEQMIRRYAGRDVYLLGVWPVLYDWAQSGLKSGLKGVFGRHSVLHTGGGTKGRELPPGWREQIFEFIGVSRHYEFYAMSELLAGSARCQAGNYHLPPVIVPFLLDPGTGKPLPREGRARGRFGAFDLLLQDRWGGVVSGDEVTLAGWDEPCGCGRPGVYVEPDIRRYSVADGGSDKISCAASSDAYERAVEVLAEAAEGAA